jgi:hypothetical protein
MCVRVRVRVKRVCFYSYECAPSPMWRGDPQSAGGGGLNERPVERTPEQDVEQGGALGVKTRG